MQQKILKSFADLRFAILILILIACFSIIGTIIEQDELIENYIINYPLDNLNGLFSWKVIIGLGLNHVYKTWWFITLIVIFGISLLTCTYIQQIPSLKIARRCQFFRTKNQFLNLKLRNKLPNSLLNSLIHKLNLKNYSIFQQQHIIYCYKGLIGRIAPIIVHVSLILILLGSIISSIGGYNAQEIVSKTDIFHTQNVLSVGKFSKIPNTSSRINDFWITYNKNNKITQFYSNISILNNSGNEIKRQTVSVNHPLKYKGITYYQTDWNLVSIRISDKNIKKIQYPLSSPLTEKSKIWLSWVTLNENLTDGFTILVNNLEGYISLYDKTGTFLGDIELNETLSLSKDKHLIIDELINSTGLQIKTDPGIPLIYVGFMFLMLSIVVSYITYSQIWVIEDKKIIYIGGNTTRAKFDFELEFFLLMNN
jgi:cytochrome c biogenesis protein